MDTSLINLLFLGSIFAIFYFLMIRPQAKKQKEQASFLNELKKGDEVVTSSGIFGKISKLDESTVQLQIDQKTYLNFTKGSVNKEMTDAFKKSRSKDNND